MANEAQAGGAVAGGLWTVDPRSLGEEGEGVADTARDAAACAAK